MLEKMNEADDQCAGMTQFNFTGRQNVPQQGIGQLRDSASSMQPDLSLSLSFSSLARPPFSLRNRLEINEGAPPPPRDFLSLSMSSSTLQPTAPGPLQQQPHQSLFQQELQTAPFLEYQRRIIEETQRRLLEQMMGRERLMLPPMQQQMLTVPPGLQRRSQQVVFPTLVLPHQQLTGLPPVVRHQQQQQVMAMPLPQQQVSVVSASQGLSPSLVPSGMAVEIASVLKHRAFRRAMNYLQTGHSPGTINIPAEGSSSSISTQTNLAPTPAANKGKQPLLPGSETSPIVISSPSSSEAVLVEDPEPKSVAKKMRLMREKGWEDWIQLKSKTAPSGELKLGCDADEKVTEGFLYRYYTGEISIFCSCHGVFLTPAEFVAHAAGDDADKL